MHYLHIVLDSVGRLGDRLLALILYDDIAPRCKPCRTRMQKTGQPRLYLLPCWHGDTYQPSLDYYLQNCVPIDSIDEIPTGRRACRVTICQCPQCGARLAMVQDFLRVRGEELVKHRFDYEVQALAPLLLKQKSRR